MGQSRCRGQNANCGMKRQVVFSAIGHSRQNTGLDGNQRSDYRFRPCPVEKDKGPGRSWKREREDEETILPGGGVDDPAHVGGLLGADVRASRLLSRGASTRLYATVLRAVRVPAGGSGGWLRRAKPKLERAGGRIVPDLLCSASESLRRSVHDLPSVVLIVPATQLGIAIT
jgi:hypothetical protein